MNCEQMTDLLSAFLDGELTAIEQKQVQEHLEQCPECRALYEQLQTLHTSFSDLEEIPAPENFAQGVMSRIKAEQTPAKPKVIPLFKRPQMRAVMGLAACAVLCIGFAQVALNGSNKSASMAPAPEAAMPESAAYDASVQTTSGLSDYARAENAPAEVVEAPAASAAPMEPAMPEPGEAMPELESQLDSQSVGSPEKAELIENCIVLHELPEGFEAAVGQLQWEEREDGALCAQLDAEQMEKLLKLADKQSIPTEVTYPTTGETGQWLLVLTQ